MFARLTDNERSSDQKAARADGSIVGAAEMRRSHRSSYKFQAKPGVDEIWLELHGTSALGALRSRKLHGYDSYCFGTRDEFRHLLLWLNE